MAKITHTTAKTDCVKIYEFEKKILKDSLKHMRKVSLTTDMWKSKNQNIEYMFITGHWMESHWKLKKRVLNFVHIPPSQGGVEIANSIFKCFKE